jgi:hypothetical protein
MECSEKPTEPYPRAFALFAFVFVFVFVELVPAWRPTIFFAAVFTTFFLLGPVAETSVALDLLFSIRSVSHLTRSTSSSVLDLDTPRILAVSRTVAKRLSTLIG